MEKLNRFELNDPILWYDGGKIKEDKVVGIRLTENGEVEYLLESHRDQKSPIFSTKGDVKLSMYKEPWLSNPFIGRNKIEVIDKLVEKIKQL